MIALDTNLLVRYLVQYDPLEAAMASEFIETRLTNTSPGFISLIVLCELWWVLTAVYKHPTARVRQALQQLSTASQILVESPDLAERALFGDESNLADQLIHLIGQKNGCTTTVTFDKRFARLEGVELLGSSTTG